MYVCIFLVPPPMCLCARLVVVNRYARACVGHSQTIGQTDRQADTDNTSR